MKPAKVLYISYNAASEPLGQSQVIPYIEKLAEYGVNISLLTYEKKADADILRFNKALKKRLAESRIIWYRLRYHKSPSLPATIYDIFQGVVFVFFLLFRHRFNIIHARQVVPATVCLALRKIANFKWIFDMRGFVAEEYVGHGSWREKGLKFRLVKFIERHCLFNADFITVLTYRQEERILKRFPALDTPFKVIPCCVDLKRFSLTSQKNQEIIKELGLEQRFVLIYLGSLGTCYFLEEMIDYFLHLKEKISNAFFLFITHSDKRPIMIKAEEKGLSNDSFKAITSTYQRVPAFLSVGDAGIYFINPYEKIGSFPIKTGEYLACGLPIIINSGIGDTSEIVERYQVGTVIENFSTDEYQRSLDELLELLTQRDVLRNRCRDVANRYLSLNLGSHEYKDIYATLLEKKR